MTIFYDPDQNDNLGSLGELGSSSSQTSAPIFNIHIPGFDNKVAQNTYTQCIAAGISSDQCAQNAVTSQGGYSVQVSNKHLLKLKPITDPVWNTIKLGGKKAGNAIDDYLLSSRFVVAVIGILMVGSALFMFGLSSFNPISEIKNVA